MIWDERRYKVRPIRWKGRDWLRHKHRNPPSGNYYLWKDEIWSPSSAFQDDGGWELIKWSHTLHIDY